jgi:hypothetical protein
MGHPACKETLTKPDTEKRLDWNKQGSNVAINYYTLSIVPCDLIKFFPVSLGQEIR